MKLKEWIMVQKKKREAKKRQKLERKMGVDPAEFERALPIEDVALQNLNADAEEFTPPESRYTEEYKEFIKKQEESLPNKREEQ